MQPTKHQLPSELAGLGISAMEEWMLKHLETEPLPFDSMAAIMEDLHERGHREAAASCAELLYDELTRRTDAEHILELWQILARQQSDNAEFTETCRKKLELSFNKQPRMLLYLDCCGFGEQKLEESLRRLRVLQQLAPDTICWQKTWGLGSVKSLSDFDRQVRIDFDKKPGHQMSYAYAAESLQPLPEQHIFSQYLRDPDSFTQRLAQEPGAIVKDVLRDFGPLNVMTLQELLAGRIFPEEQWKSFWESARRALKTDPEMEFPTRRQDPLRLLEVAKKIDQDWLARFVNERDFDLILAGMEKWKEAVPSRDRQTIPAEILDRLNFVISGAGPAQTQHLIQALLAADELRQADAGTRLAALAENDKLIELFNDLPKPLLRRILQWWRQNNRDKIIAGTFDILRLLTSAGFGEATAFLQKEADARLNETLFSALHTGQATPAMILWLCRNVGGLKNTDAALPARLADAALHIAENDLLTGEQRATKNQIRGLLEQPARAMDLFKAMAASDRLKFGERLLKSPAWPPAKRRAILYHYSQLFPEMENLLMETVAPVSMVIRHATSYRSYRARQAQLQHLINVEIPQNSRDIATARSHGDLRENFEYQAAREAQNLLMRRRAELEEQLQNVNGTQFDDSPADAAGAGTCVEIAYADGRRGQFTILGEWDNEPELGIISSQSQLAKSLIGRKPGEKTSVPSETGAMEATILSVSALSPQVRAWLDGE